MFSLPFWKYVDMLDVIGRTMRSTPNYGFGEIETLFVFVFQVYFVKSFFKDPRDSNKGSGGGYVKMRT
jgi:hypothetical protein